LESSCTSRFKRTLISSHLYKSSFRVLSSSQMPLRDLIAPKNAPLRYSEVTRCSFGTSSYLTSSTSLRYGLLISSPIKDALMESSGFSNKDLKCLRTPGYSWRSSKEICDVCISTSAPLRSSRIWKCFCGGSYPQKCSIEIFSSHNMFVWNLLLPHNAPPRPRPQQVSRSFFEIILSITRLIPTK